jgi:hypothetical protein
MHAAAPPGPPTKRKWEGQSNGGGPGESSGRQQQQKPVAKQVKVEPTSFLNMVRMINENTEVKNSYLANGKNYKCAVCNRYVVDMVKCCIIASLFLTHIANTSNTSSLV